MTDQRTSCLRASLGLSYFSDGIMTVAAEFGLMDRPRRACATCIYPPALLLQMSRGHTLNPAETYASRHPGLQSRERHSCPHSGTAACVSRRPPLKPRREPVRTSAPIPAASPHPGAVPPADACIVAVCSIQKQCSDRGSGAQGRHPQPGPGIDTLVAPRPFRCYARSFRHCVMGSHADCPMHLVPSLG